MRLHLRFSVNQGLKESKKRKFSCKKKISTTGECKLTFIIIFYPETPKKSEESGKFEKKNLNKKFKLVKISIKKTNPAHFIFNSKAS